MGLFSLFRSSKKPNFNSDYPNRAAERRASHRIASDINSSRRPGLPSATPGQRFLVLDDKGIGHYMKIGEDGKVFVDEEARERLEESVRDAPRMKEERRRARKAEKKAQEEMLAGHLIGLGHGEGMGIGMGVEGYYGTEAGFGGFGEQFEGLHGPSQRASRLQQQQLLSPFASINRAPKSPQHSLLPFQPQPPSHSAFQQHSQRLQGPASFVDPLITTHLPIGARGQRKYVPGQSKLDPKQFGPLNDPSANYKHLKALEALRRKNERKGRGGSEAGGSRKR
ncbi:Nn.00g068370.m01.CDS01 [Neocucurbitaria sp. VM-36]